MQIKSLLEFLSTEGDYRIIGHSKSHILSLKEKNEIMKTHKFGAYTIQNIVIIESLDLDP